jgi:mono/diheme cytochrome c family protein
MRQVVAPTGAAAKVYRGLANALSVSLIVYLTYFFTTFFSTHPRPPAAIPDEVRIAAKKIDERRAEDRRLLTTYGTLDAATKNLRLPIDRGMELLVAESAQPIPPVNPATPAPAPPGAAPKPEATATAAPNPEVPVPPTPQPAAVVALAPTVTTPAAAPATVRAPARVGMPPAQLYRAICQACHDTDGRGSIVRKAMPAIPDLTDGNWQASRSDADLQHSILEGKGQLMLPMKDKFALARTDPKEMVAFIRGFQPERPAVAARANPQPSTAQPAPTAASLASQRASAPPASSILTQHPIAPPPPNPSSSASALALETSPSAEALALFPPAPLPTTVTPAASSRPARTATTSPAEAAKLRAAAVVYQINCVACHGADGRGTAIRPAMPQIPDFTAREWHAGRHSAKLSISILDGKGALMPPWRGKLTNEQTRDLVAYVRSFGPADHLAAETPVSEFELRFRALSKQWDELDQQIRALTGR